MELPMSETNSVSPLRQRMIEDMAARKLNPHTQRSHVYSCKRFAAWLKRSPDTATPDEVRRFQLYLIESGASLCNRNRIMTGVRFLFRVTLRRHDLAAEVWHIKEPQKLPPVLSPEEVKRILAMATSLKARAMLTLAYGCGLRAGEVVRLRASDIDSEQMIIRIVQSKGRKDRHVMLPAEVLELLRQWWKARSTEQDAGVAVMSAIERCRTAALGGHVARCENVACGHTLIAFNSCRNRHCPKCQTAASRRWLADREAELLPVPYFHVVYTLPSKLRDIAYQNKRVVYDLLMKAAAETTLAIAANPKRLGARIGITAVLHTWGSTLTHHPHVHMIVPGGGLSLDGARWVAARSNFLVHVKVLARLFRGKMLAMLMHAQDAGELKFFNTHAGLADKRTFKRFIAPLRRIKWVVYCKAPFAGPEQVLRYLSRYTHRVAISNRRLVAADDDAITFRWKDYRVNGPGRWKTMRLDPHEFIRRFLLHVLPKGFHRIRHYGLFASANRAESIATARALLNVAPPAADPQEQPDVAPDSPRVLPCPCPRCGARMIVIEVFARGCEPSWRPTPIRIDTS